MSDPSPFGGGSFFESLLGDLLKLIDTREPINWDLTRQLAQGVATGGQPETNVDPLERIRLEELSRVADLHVSDATGLASSTGGGVVTVLPVGRAEWSWRTLEAWRPLLESMARALARGRPQDPPPADLGFEEGADLSQLLGRWASAMGPTLLSLQFGSSVGHLAQRSMGQYDLPVPRPQSDELLMVPANVAGFAEDWTLPLDDVRLWICVSELTHHAVLGRPHVRKRLLELLDGYVSGFEPDPRALEERLGDMEPGDPASLQRALGDPTALLGDMRTPTQKALLTQLEALVAALEGYVDHVLDAVGRRLIGSYGPLSEALRRRRVERGEGQRFVEHLFGLGLGQEQFDRGAAFVNGIVERAGEDHLGDLWASARNLPTPAEVDAPGLWLERISLPEDEPGES